MSSEQNEKIPTLEEKGQNNSNETSNNNSAFSSFVKNSEQNSGEATESLSSLPSSELVFEITYLEDPITKKDAQAYTKTEPTFALNGVVTITDAFGCLVLKETVLGRQTVEKKCRKSLDKTNFTVDCKQGILIKAVEPQKWMFEDQDKTQLEFDKEVLEAFRVVQEAVKKEMHEQAIQQARIQSELEKEAALRNQHGGGNANQGVPIHNPVYNLRPGDEGYNPNNDPNRRGQPMRVNDESLEDL